MLRLALTLVIISILLVVLWLAGMVSGYTVGGLIHIVLIIAPILFVIGLILLIVRIVSGRAAT